MDKMKFQQLLSLLESSSGKQMQHSPVETGMHEGTKAMGEFGIMPITAQELSKQDSNKSELDKLIMGADPASIEEILASNPGKYQEYVDQMSNKVLDKSGGNAEEAAMRWLAGPNSSKRRIANVAEETPGRAEKIQEFLKSSQPVEPSFTEKLQEQFPPEEVLYNKIRSKLGGQ